MGRITIDMGQNGALTIQYPGLTPLAVIALLELAKATIIKQVVSGEPTTPPKPNIVVPTPVLPS